MVVSGDRITKAPSSTPLLNYPIKYVSVVMKIKQTPIFWSFLKFPMTTLPLSSIVIPGPSLLKI